MDASLRNTPGLISENSSKASEDRANPVPPAKIERLRDDLIKHFEALVGHAGIDRSDRNTTAVTQYQMQVETAALIRAAEEFQILIRQLQEMWLFGQLNTVGESRVQQQTDENAKIVADLLKELFNRQPASSQNDVDGSQVGVVNGTTQESS